MSIPTPKVCYHVMNTLALSSCITDTKQFNNMQDTESVVKVLESGSKLKELHFCLSYLCIYVCVCMYVCVCVCLCVCARA